MTPETDTDGPDHTPGPWTVRSHEWWEDKSGQDRWHDWLITDAEDSGVKITVIPHTFDATEADARLIAAAPDLLDALREYVAYQEQNMEGDLNQDRDVFEDIMEDKMEQAKAAIAKAEGDSV